jgi:hypothetical protein
VRPGGHPIADLALEPIEAIEPRAFRIERWLFGTPCA